MKTDVGKNSTIFKLKDVKVFAEAAIEKVTPEFWQNCEEHVIHEEMMMWKLDGLMVDRLVIHVSGAESSTAELDSSESFIRHEAMPTLEGVSRLDDVH